jgi:nucleotide-binding universal stress UspA family protein
MNFQHILVTTDFSEASFAAFDIASYQAKMAGTKLTLLTIVPDWEVPPSILEHVPMPERINEYRQQIFQASTARLSALAKEKFHGQKVETIVLISSRSQAAEICDFAKKQHCDLIVMSSTGHGALASLVVGSTTQRVLLESPCPVLVIPALRR